MKYRQFLLYNVVGAVAWAIGMPLLGYFLGSVIPDPDKYLLPIVLLIIFISVLPTAWHMFRHKSDRERLYRAFWQGWQRVRTRRTPASEEIISRDLIDN
jgi:predicted branched-subunit amino acid permease